MNTIEKELKLSLSNESEYLKLLAYFKNGISYYQHNLFFDSKEKILQKKFLALRLRFENSYYFITLKGPKSLKDEITIREEIECEISKEDAHLILNDKKNIIEIDCLPIKTLKEKINDINEIIITKFIDFKNLRTQLLFNSNNKEYVLELDKTYFANGNIEFELEVEFNETDPVFELKNELKNVFKKSEIPWKLSNESKLSKAIKFSCYYCDN